MKVLKNISLDLEQRIVDTSVGNTSRPSILLCGGDPRLKKICIKVLSELVLLPHTQ